MPFDEPAGTIHQLLRPVRELDGTIVEGSGSVSELGHRIGKFDGVRVDFVGAVGCLIHFAVNGREACQQSVRRLIPHLGGHGIPHSCSRLRHDVGEHIVIGVVRDNFQPGGLRVNGTGVAFLIRFERAGTHEPGREVFRNHERKIIGPVANALDGLITGLYALPVEGSRIQQALFDIRTGVQIVTGGIFRTLVFHHECAHNTVHIPVGIPVAVQVQ